MCGCSAHSKAMKDAETYIHVNELEKVRDLLDLES